MLKIFHTMDLLILLMDIAQKKTIVMMHMQQTEHIYNICGFLIHVMFVLINMIQQHKDYIIIVHNKKV